MHVLFTSQVFPPEGHPTAIMVRDLAGYMVARGHRAVVACGYPHHPHGRVLGGYRMRPFLRECAGGVDVVRGGHLLSVRRGMVSRAAVMVTQAVGMTLAAHLAGFRPDVVINFGPPLLGPLCSATVASRYGVPLVSVIYDLYPDVAVETGVVRNSLLIAAARWAERQTYTRSTRVVVLSEGFRRTVTARGVPEYKVLVLPVWLGLDEVKPSSRENPWREEQGIPASTFVVLYAGTMGLVSGAEMLVGVADRLRNVSDLLLLLVGAGEVKATIEAKARSLGLANVKVLPFQDRLRVAEVQATADVSVVTLAPGRGRTSVPSKVIGYMAAGRPVIAAVDEDSDTAVCVRGGSFGVVVPPGDTAAATNAILDLKKDQERRDRLGAAARKAFERGYSAPAILDQYASLLECLGSGHT